MTEGNGKIKERLMTEVEELRARVTELEIVEIECKQAEEVRRENEELMRNIAENYPNSYISIIEKDFTIGFTSGQEFKKQNLDPEQFIGLTLEQVFGSQVAIVRCHYEDTFKGEECSFELFINNQHQLYRTVPLHSEDGSIHRILVVVENITERKRAEEELRIKEHTIAHSLNGIALSDMDGKVFYANDSLVKMLDFISDRDILGKSFRDFIQEEKSSNVEKRMQRIFNKGEWRGESVFKKKDGSDVHFQLSINLVEDSTGTPICISASFEDITERKKAEEKIQESEEKFHKTFMVSPYSIIIAKLDGIIVDVNGGFEKNTGYNREEVIGKTAIEIGLLKDPKDHEKMQKMIKKEGNLRNFEMEMVDKDGKEIISLISTEMIELKGEPHLIVVGNNITERKQAEEALRQSEGKYRTLVEGLEDAIVSFFLDGTISYCSPNVRNFGGYDPEEEIGKHFSKYIADKEVKKKLQELFQGIIKMKKPVTFEFLYRPKSKDPFYVEATASPIIDEDTEEIVSIQCIVRDITERKRAEQALQKSKETAERYLDIAAELIITLDTRGNITLLNESGHGLLGYRTGELIGRNWFDTCLPRQARKDVREVFKKLMRGEIENVETYENPVLTKNGEERMILWHNTLLRDDEGRITGILSSGEDITDRKCAEGELCRSEEKYRSLAETSTDGIFTLDIKGNFTYINPTFEKITGHLVRDFLGRSFIEVLAPEYIESTIETFKRGIAGERTPLYEIELMCRDGGKVPIELNMTLLLDVDGRIIGRLGIARDITERKQAEEALRKQQDTINALIVTSRDWIWALDSELVHTYSNPAVEAILGYHPDKIIGQHSIELMHPDDAEKLRETLDKWISEKRGWKDLVIRWRHKNGSYRYLESNAVPILDAEGELIGFRGVDRDITERKGMEERRKELERIKSDFIILNAHELGTPLMVIYGYLDTLKDFNNQIGEDGRDAIQHIEMNLKRIEKLQKAMYNITLLEQNKFSLNKTPLFIHHIAKNVLNELRIMAERKGISFVPSFPSFNTILADADRIHKVISILVDNAIKYTPEGGTIEISGSENDRNIELTVKDNGIGIALKEQKKVFEEFYQVEDIMGHKDGFGLGLSLAKGIIESHGGDIRVESVPGKGSSFHIRIPKE